MDNTIMEKRPFLSVIVTIYNKEKYLRQCIESILSQSFRDMEIILVDDGSLDGSGQICDEYAAADERVLVIHKQNAGLVEARKSGLSASHGTYITYVDADDWIDREMYEVLCEIGRKHQPDLICTEHLLDKGDEVFRNRIGFEEGLYQGEDLEKVMDRIIYMRNDRTGIYGSVCTKLFRKELLEACQYIVPSDLTNGEDMMVSYRAFLKMKSLYVYRKHAFYHYRYVPDSMVRHIDPRWLSQFAEVFRCLGDMVETEAGPYRESFQRQLDYSKVYTLYRGIDGTAGKITEFADPQTFSRLKALAESDAVIELTDSINFDRIKVPEVEKRLILNLRKGKINLVLMELVRIKLAYRHRNHYHKGEKHE